MNIEIIPKEDGFDNVTKKQDETIKEIRNGFDNVTKKQDETIKEISNEG